MIALTDNLTLRCGVTVRGLLHDAADNRVTGVRLEAGGEHSELRADLVVDAAPLFQERLAMNDAAERQGKPVIEAAMFEMEASLTVIHPPETARFRELVPEVPAGWKRRFPVLGAISGTVACLAATEAIKLITQIGDPLKNKLLRMDLRTMRFETIHLR